MLTHAQPPGSKVSIFLLILSTTFHFIAANIPPSFQNFTQNVIFPESTPIGTVLVSLTASDPDDTNLTFTISGEGVKSVLKLRPTGPKSADIELASALDREVVPNYKVLCEVSDKGQLIKRYLTIYIKDVNDNAPSFVNLPYRASLPEDSPMGTSVFKVSATDPDNGEAGFVSYNITSKDGLFSINTATGEVTLAQDLDYETEKFYQLEIIAFDLNNLNSTTDLIINIVDVQDSPPFFFNLPYVTSIAEDAAVGTQVLQITAIDGDRSNPNPILYSFIDGDFSYFNIDAKTGWISIKTPIDRENSQIFAQLGALKMTVMAQEDTASPHGQTSTKATVSIHILDVNDQIPMFAQSSYEAVIQENSVERIPITLLPLGTEIIIRDLDEGDNGRMEVHLEKDGQPFDIFEVYPTTVLNEAQLLVRVKNPAALDYELVKEFTFEIVASESLTPDRYEGRTEVIVRLDDVNDNWPEFTQDVYNASIYENSALGTNVTTITATDQDSGNFGQIQYKLRGAASSLFTVDPLTGLITVAVNANQDLNLLNRERIDEQYLTLEAQDGGGLRTLVQLGIKLLDVNDNAPQIMRSFYEGFISENSDSLDRPLMIEATDADLPPNNALSFSIVEGDPFENFTIDSLTGSISVRSPLDYEDMDPSMDGKFELKVLARDGGLPSLSSFTDVTIFVQDINDEQPFFQPLSYSSVFSEDTTGGTLITQVFCFDNDGTAPNNEIIYRIESGAQDKFRMDAETGQLTVEYRADLDRDKFPHTYTLTVLAIDRGTPANTGTGTIEISISDVNNKDPEFIPDQRATRVAENTAVGVEFYSYEATDSDVNALLVYSLVEEDIYGWNEKGMEVTDKDYLRSLFSVHSTNGSIFVHNALDREVVEEVRLTLFVEDLNAEKPTIQNNTGSLTIVISDINDQPPTFTPSQYYSARVSEAAKPGTEIVRVVAIDYDKNSGDIQYRMVYDTDESLAFEITDLNRQTGIITLGRSIDRELTSWVNITVIAEDNGTPALRSQAWVYVEIEDVNDNSPEWQVFVDPVELWENAPPYTEVTQVKATDQDSLEFGSVLYFLAGDHDVPFVINNLTGLIETSALLDRESHPVYDITIEARDNINAPATQQRRTPGYMRIRLKDINDNPPQFEQNFYSASTLENANIDHVFAAVRANDQDEGINAEISYSIDFDASNSTNLFDIQPSNGAVYVKTTLQGKMGSYQVVVKATDHGFPVLSNSTILLVTVEDVNDHSPVIQEPEANATISIPENVLAGYHVTQVIASDADEGINGRVQFQFVESLGNTDWKYFTIDRMAGNITTNAVIDREQQEFYFVEVKAYDLGKPQYDDRRIISIQALDEDDNPPEFDRSAIPPPFVVSVQEEESNIHIANLNIANDPDIGKNAEICYFIVGGDRPYMNDFYMNKSTGELWLENMLDRERIPAVNLIIKATEACTTNHWEREENRRTEWNETDLTLLWIQVLINDINDNAPRFTKKWFTAGVTRDTQYNSDVINLADYAVDPDEGSNAMMLFGISSSFHITPQLENDLQGKVPFTLDSNEGIIRTNVYFQELWQGYVEFSVSVNDSSPSHTGLANVSIYLLSEQQRVKVIIRGDPDYVGSFRDTFAEFVSNITGTIINVDNIRTHKDSSGNPDGRRTDMFIHAINAETGEVLASPVLIELIDRNYIHLVDLFNNYNVIEVVPSVQVRAASSLDQDLLLALIVTAIVLGLLILIILSTFIFCRRKYKRKLKAATAMAFGSHDNGLNRLEMPNTNQHTYEGSNPIWLEQYENGWPEDSDSDSRNSLDENAIERTPKTKGFDEQEVSMPMYNDEFDHFNQLPNTPKHRDGDVILKAALQDHENKMTANNRAPKAATNGSAKRSVSPSNGTVPPGYQNHGFQLEATEI